MTIREPEATIHAAFGGYLLVLRTWEDSAGDRSETMHMCASIEEAILRIKHHVEHLESSSQADYEGIERATRDSKRSSSN